MDSKTNLEFCINHNLKYLNDFPMLSTFMRRSFPKKDPMYFDSQQIFTYSKRTLEKLEEGVEYT